MLSLVNYGSSGEEDNISDEEEATTVSSSIHENGAADNDKPYDSLLENSSKIQLPQPKTAQSSHPTIEEEEDDEFLHKKAVPEVTPPPPKIKQKVKIMIPRLSDFKDNDEEEEEGSKFSGPSAPNRRTGLLGMLPKPAHSIVSSSSKPLSIPPAAKPSTASASSKPPSGAATSSSTAVKKIGLIPYTLMEHKKNAESNKKPTKRKGKDSDDSDDDDDDSTEPFFTFASNQEDLPKVNEEEIKAMVERETNRMELRKMQAEELHQQLESQPDYSQYYQQEEQQSSTFDEQAIKTLVGGTKAKRSKLDNIQIVDISDQDVLPNKEDWLRKSLAGETSYVPTGQIDEKGPALSKRKHQITYLSMRAEKNVAELEAMWAANRQSNREGRSKYGF